jgi:hypothetical protein
LTQKDQISIGQRNKSIVVDFTRKQNHCYLANDLANDLIGFKL